VKSRAKPLSSCTNTGTSAEFLPARLSLPQLRAAVQDCRGCDLYCNATQAVFGQGPSDATVMFVGEQPGDQEDRAGKPFVGPAGRLLDQVLDDVGIDRANDVFLTNAVKHFKWEPRGKMRLHSKPSARESAACRPWLEAEIAVVKPQMIVCLGATAAQSLLGAAFRVTKQRGQILTDQKWAPWMMATYHPSALLRMPDEDARRLARESFTSDLRAAAKQINAFKAHRASVVRYVEQWTAVHAGGIASTARGSSVRSPQAVRTA
jgi:DNA polymerase